MPKFFIDVAGEDAPEKGRHAVDLPDREAAREYAIGLAETILRGKDDAGHKRSLVLIRSDNEEVLDEIHSERE